MKQLILLLSLATIALLAEGLYLMVRDRVGRGDKAIRESLHAIRTGTPTKKPGGGILRTVVLSKSPFIHKVLSALPLTQFLDAALEQAHIRMLLDRFLLVVTASGLGFALLAIVVTKGLLFGFTGLIFGLIVPWIYVIYMKRRRMSKLSEQLPEALDTVVRSLRAGLALSMAFEVVSKELPPPISTEFKKINEENRLGVTMKDSMEHLLHRCDNMDVKLFATSVLIQWEIGGSLTEILNNLGYTIRERFKLRGHIKALTAEGRLSGLVLGVLPLAVGVVIYYLSPGYLDPLFTTTLGKILLFTAGSLVLFGALVIKKIVTIEI